ncbi:MAG: carboxypeptidase-like regulatory domain-containing protein, partial [Gemmatimonadota bacterium]|nr:carboxypeptidase-like regulatory domain-containing protein [Gemmatimonadota bacterium]
MFHSMSNTLGRFARLCAATLLAAVLAAPAAAQNLGTITGQVTSTSMAPLSEVQVFIVGTQMGGLTASNGRYLIRNVAPGTYEVRAVRIGYQTLTQSVTVTAG